MRKVFLPKWQRWFLFPLFGGMWVFFTYLEFFSPGAQGELGLVGYIFFTLMFWGLGIMFWLMTSGKLPAYYLEDGDKDKKD